MENKIVIAASHNAAANLAGEARLIADTTISHILYLWENDPCVVIGRNQNPYEECNLEAMEQNHVLLVKRNSGGGAVYHDRGNLCFTLITDKDSGSKEENFRFVIDVLASLGIHAELSGRNDILVGGKKVSGNAFQYTKERFCHHGTMLVSTDLSVVSHYLTPSKEKLATHAVRSVASRIGNLQETVSTLTIDELEEAFISVFQQQYGSATIAYIDYSNLPEAREFSDKDIILKKTPPFAWKQSHRFPWGSVTVCLEAEQGIITRAEIASDMLDANQPGLWEQALIGKPFSRSACPETKEAPVSVDFWSFLKSVLPS